MTPQETTPIEIRLRAFPSTTGHVAATYRPPSKRLTSGLLTLLGFLATVPIVVFIPPHVPWVLAVVCVGTYMAYRRWTGEYIVHSLEATCPSCGQPLTMKPDQYVRLPHTVPCFNCHQEPELTLTR
jgi:hypothetical protein